MLNSTGMSILGLFDQQMRAEQLKMHSQCVEVYIPEWIWCKDQKEGCHWDRVLVYFLLMGNFESCYVMSETCKTWVICCWHLSLAENQIFLSLSSYFITKVVVFITVLSMRGSPFKKDKATDSIWRWLGDKRIKLALFNDHLLKTEVCLLVSKWYLQKKECC